MDSFLNKRKKFRIPALMILSQFMLIVFVGYWLLGQYSQEKQALKKELFHEYIAARDQVIDSLLFKHLINPALGDSTKIVLNILHDSTSSSITHIYKNKKPKKNKIIAIGLQNEPDSQSLNSSSFLFTQIIKEDALKRSVKMIINQTDQLIGTSGYTDRLFHLPLDDVLFKKIFLNSLNVNSFDFKLEWLQKADSLELVTSGITLNGESNESLPAVNISKYTAYLFKKVWPQMLFAIFLLGLSASAFFFTYLSLKKQMQLNTLRNDFISNITHELKTPVSTAKVALEALKTYDMKKDPKVTNEYLDMVSLEMKRLDGLIAKVLSHSILEEQKSIIHKEKLDLVLLIKNTLRSMQMQFSKFNAKINFEPVEVSCIVEIDQLYVEAVIINLLDNSLKYAGPDPNISISIRTENNYVFLSVNDKGPGIPKEYMPKLFDKFFRVPFGDKHNVKGYGLGLSFAALVMKQHQGGIYAENLPEGGSSFILKFPNIK